MNITQTDEYQALLRTIIEQREYDTPRLILADYLEENGERDRAEFIRIQCRLAQLTELESLEYLECKVCGNTPNEEGYLEHGKGCYTQDENGGGSEWFDLNERQLFQIRERRVENYHRWAKQDLHSVWNEIGQGKLSGTYTRGFISSISIAWEDWLKQWQAIRESTPLEKVEFTSYPIRLNGEYIFIADGELTENWLKRRLPQQFSDLEIILPKL